VTGSVAKRIDNPEWNELAVELDGRRVPVEETGCDGDDVTSEVAEGHLVVDATHADRRVAPHTPTDADGERGAQVLLDDARLFRLGEYGCWCTAQDPAVRRALIVAGEPRAQLGLHIGERCDGANVVERLLAHAPPEALHLAAGLRVVRTCVEKSRAEPATHEREDRAPVRGSVVEVQQVRLAVLHQRAREERQHGFLALVACHAQRDDEARGVVQESVHADRCAAAVQREGRSVTYVSVPERIRTRCLPAKTRPAGLAVVVLCARQALLAQHSPHRALFDVRSDSPVRTQRAQHERDADVGMLTADVTEELLEHGIEAPAATTIGTATRGEGREAALFECVQPPLQARHRVAPRCLATRWPYALHAETPELRRALAVVERSPGELPDEPVTK
jgi:hypothetical protein